MKIRAVALSDVPALVEVHEGSEGPWVNPVECALWVNHRLLRPFLCRVVERDGRIVGHAEWIVGHEPDLPAPYLYLGMMQVRPDSRGTGAGRALVEDGFELARERGCDRLRTVPEDDAVGFYERCAFRRTARARHFRLAVEAGALEGWRLTRSVPARAARDLPMRLGWAQACSSHIWELCNRPVEMAGEPWFHPVVTTGTGAAYVQLRVWKPGDALAAAWAPREVPLSDLISAARGLAARRRVESLLLAVRPGETVRMKGAEPAGEIAVIERPIR